MAEGLAKKGHHPRTLDQVWAKVKELRQGYARAREHSSTSREAPQHCTYFQELDRFLHGEEPLSAPVLVQTGLQTPIQHCQKVAEDNPEQQLQDDDEEEDPNRSVVTLTLEPAPQTQEASQPDLLEQTSMQHLSHHPPRPMETAGTGGSTNDLMLRPWKVCKRPWQRGRRKRLSGSIICWRSSSSSGQQSVALSRRPWVSQVLLPIATPPTQPALASSAPLPLPHPLTPLNPIPPSPPAITDPAEAPLLRSPLLSQTTLDREHI
nr:uncharacterized protein LOC112546002 isoform X1 [Pelodiscus sinensis]|eukprot:XP_025041070.1 uncharacterized protein LOC112546002 isoform X1 [Pelodiscus sinensis]